MRSGTRAFASRHRLLLAVLAVLSIPVLWSAAARMAGGWVPDGDDASIARRTMQVFSTDPPLIGQESTADVPYEDQSPNHLGPVGYYAMAIPYAASGWSPIGLIAGAALVALAAIATCVVIGERTAGRRGLVAVGLGLALLTVRLGENWTVRPLNAAMVVFPMVAMLLGMWAYLRRDRVGLAVVLIAGSFCLQVSLETLPVAGLTGLVCIVLAAHRRFVGHEQAPRTGAWWAVVGVLAIMWLPPLVNVVVRWPGNLTVVGEYLLGQIGVVPHTSVKPGRLGLGPAVGSVLTYGTSLPGIDHRDFSGDLEVLVPFGQVAVLPLVAGLASFALAVNWAITRGSAALRSLLAVVVTAVVAAAIGLAERPGSELATQTYFVIWLQTVVAVAWMAVALAAIEIALHVADRSGIRSSRVRRIPIAAGAATIALLAVVVAPRGEPVVRQPSRQITALSRQVRAQVPPGTYLIVGEGFSSWISVSKGLGTDLLAHGYDIRFEDSNEMEDEPRRQGTRDLPRLVVTDRLPDVAGPDLVARYVEPGAVFLVRLAPGGPDTDWCADVGSLAYRIGQVTGAAPDQDRIEPVVTPSMWADVLAEVDPAELARARPGTAQAEAATILTSGLAATIDRLASGAVDEPDASQVSALRVLLATFDATCRAELVAGAERLAAGGGEVSP